MTVTGLPDKGLILIGPAVLATPPTVLKTTSGARDRAKDANYQDFLEPSLRIASELPTMHPELPDTIGDM
jgi:hypothetical protein